jgi:hypothetical protein
MTYQQSSRGGTRRPCLLTPAVLLLCIIAAASAASTDWQLKLTASLDRGVNQDFGSVIPYFRTANDTDPLLVFRSGASPSYLGIFYFRYQGWNQYSLVKIDTSWDDSLYIYPWDAGDINGDSSCELAAYYSYTGQDRNGDYVAVNGLRAANGLPDSLEWSQLYGIGGAPLARHYVTDLDRDGRREITFFDNDARDHPIRVYESISRDSMLLVDTILPPDFYEGNTLAFGDFDSDGLIEFACGSGYPGSAVIFKCIDDNQSVLWDSVLLGREFPNGNIDIFSSDNVDGTHIPSLFNTHHDVPRGICWLHQYVPTEGTHGWQAFLIDSTDVPPSAYMGGVSASGDIDGDSIDEVIWSSGAKVRIYRWTGPHQYECIWSWLAPREMVSCARVSLSDMNRNGYPEIIVSGINQTAIFEMEAIRILNPNGQEMYRPGDTCPIRWQTFSPPRCDSVSLFCTADNGMTYASIARGLSPDDTGYTWIVPNISSDSCRIKAVAFGPHWQRDESDSVFSIRVVGVEHSGAQPIYDTRLLGAFPNLATGKTRVSFQLREQGNISLVVCDVTGRTVSTLARGPAKPGVHETMWNTRSISPGVYFIRLQTPDFEQTRKIIVAE